MNFLPSMGLNELIWFSSVHILQGLSASYQPNASQIISSLEQPLSKSIYRIWGLTNISSFSNVEMVALGWQINTFPKCPLILFPLVICVRICCVKKLVGAQILKMCFLLFRNHYNQTWGITHWQTSRSRRRLDVASSARCGGRGTC